MEEFVHNNKLGCIFVENSGMKSIKLILFLLVINIAAKADSEYLYRIHVGSFKRIDVPENIKEVPNVKKYVLPEGHNCFFSGGYFLFFEGAYRQLKKVQEKGFKKATIRVYKNEKLIPVFDGLNHIEEEIVNPSSIPANRKVDEQLFSLSKKWTLKNRADLYREIIMPGLTNTSGRGSSETVEGAELDWKLKIKKFGRFWEKKPKKVKEELKIDNIPSKKEKVLIEEKTKEKKKEKELVEEISVVEKDTSVYDEALLAAIEEGMVEEKAEEIIGENDENLELNDNYLPDEKPEFRIYLTSSDKNDRTPTSVSYVPDLVYTFQKKNLTLYTVGYYNNSAQAMADLSQYQADGFHNAKIIGIYKSVVVSQKIADDILNRYLNQK